MANAIPTYRICTLPGNIHGNEQLLIDRLKNYISTHPDIKFPHRHSFYHLVLFTDGSGRHTLDFKEHEVHAGLIYFMHPGQVHSWLFDHFVDGYIVHFEADFFNDLLMSNRLLLQFPMFRHYSPEQVIPLNTNTYHAARDIFEQLLKEINTAHCYSKGMVQVLLLQLFYQVARNTTGEKSIQKIRHNAEVVQQFIDLVEKFHTEWKYPKTFAKALHVSANYLNQMCNEVVGQSAGSIIRERRLLEAKRLLVNASLSVKEITALLHFKDNSYFCKFFKKYCYLSPEQFRHKSQHNETIQNQ